MFKICFYTNMLLLVIACGALPKNTSKVEGHFENSSENQILQYADSQRAIAEYEKSSSVLVSMPLIELAGKEDLIIAMLKTDVKNIIIVVEKGGVANFQNPKLTKLRSMLTIAEMERIVFLEQRIAGKLSLWARDWAPISAKTADGELRLLDFNYYVFNPADDFTPQSFEFTFPSVTRISIPVYNEGGNFMTNTQGHCMMTARVTEANSAAQSMASDMVLNNTQIEAYYKTYGGCSKVTIFPRMTHEGTGHIDMWAKFLNDNTVLVNEMRDATINTITIPTYRNQALEIKSYLNMRAQEIKNMGYNVVRVPMPAPESMAYSVPTTLIRSYSNALILNGTAIVPKYIKKYSDTGGISYVDESQLSSYEQEVTNAYEQVGYKVEYIDSDQLISYAGAVHCVTMQIGEAN